ncbi:hypothetical protein OF83DRAFT_361693 [Amylostereum chailletii]|nr:hypothetical protein OF83DRAFT_361693 [Amylostereum chailletii]
MFKDIDFKLKLVEAVKEMHRLGIVHHKLSEKPVLNHNMIIDFTLATKEKCKRKHHIYLGDIEPLDEEEFGCRELFDLCGSLGIWKPRDFWILDANYPVAWISDVSRIADALPDICTPEEKMRMVCEAVKDHLIHWYPDVWRRRKGWNRYVDRVSAWYAKHR